MSKRFFFNAVLVFLFTLFLLSLYNLRQVVCGQMLPWKIAPRLGLGFGSELGLGLRLGGGRWRFSCGIIILQPRQIYLNFFFFHNNAWIITQFLPNRASLFSLLLRQREHAFSEDSWRWFTQGDFVHGNVRIGHKMFTLSTVIVFLFSITLR